MEANGQLARQLRDLKEEYLDSIKEIGYEFKQQKYIENEKKQTNLSDEINKEEIEYYNEYGGFINNQKEYIIVVNKEKRLPTVWSNVVANNRFGTLVTDSQGGFTWNKNSRLKRITSWSNDQVLDIPSEIIYLQDRETFDTWSLGLRTNA